MKPNEIIWNHRHVATEKLDSDGRITETIIRDAAGYEAYRTNQQVQWQSLLAAAARFNSR